MALFQAFGGNTGDQHRVGLPSIATRWHKAESVNLEAALWWLLESRFSEVENQEAQRRVSSTRSRQASQHSL